MTYLCHSFHNIYPTNIHSTGYSLTLMRKNKITSNPNSTKNNLMKLFATCYGDWTQPCLHAANLSLAYVSLYRVGPIPPRRTLDQFSSNPLGSERVHSYHNMQLIKLFCKIQFINSIKINVRNSLILLMITPF